MSANIKCLSKDPFFDANLKMAPIHYSPHPMIPFYQNFKGKFINIFPTLRSHFKTFVNFELKVANVHQIYTKFGEFYTQKSLICLDPTTNNPYTEYPCFRSPVGTYPSLSYLSAPPGKYMFPLLIGLDS